MILDLVILSRIVKSNRACAHEQGKPDKGPVLNTDGEYSFFFKVKYSDGYNWTAVFKGVGDEFNLNNHTVETMYPDNF